MVRSPVVVVDNHPGVRTGLEYFFAAEGYDLLIHSRAADAVTVIRRVQPTLAAIELHLEYPFAGLDVVRALRADPETMAIPLIVWSSDPSLECHFASLNLPTVTVVSKFDAVAALRAVIAAIDSPVDEPDIRPVHSISL